ncbi:formylglycine-generating enzyme family protein [Tabrizicola sp.]|uniref:formylglycine-generating enzyme family protein n=1 Tax=Tabrizicola sp. TaxID=2005166 RepID=UPI003F318859
MPVRTVSIAVLSLSLALPAKADAPPDFARLAAEPPSPASAPESLAAQGAMLSVPAGNWTIGRDDARRDQRPAHTVALETFGIDRTEVTNAAFAEYLNALGLQVAGDFAAGEAGSAGLAPEVLALLAEGAEGSGGYPIIALDDAQARIGVTGGRFVVTPGYEDHPVTETTWAGGRAYCLWRGARLPTEAEWEAAARGADDRPYPWGDAAPDAARAFVSNRTGETAEVGGRPDGAGPFGALDMAGSLAEWTSSLKQRYPYDPADGREDPALPGERVTRGGDYMYDSDPETLTVSHRNGFSNAPERGHRHIGFRCAA